MTRICLVTGATGVLGPAVVEAFLNRGYRVRALARKAPPASLFGPSVEVFQGDVCDEKILSTIVRDVNVVVHLAALVHVLDPPPSLRPEYERINVRGTETLVRSCGAANVDRLVYFSTIAVYGYTRNRVLTETTAAEPYTFYGRTKLDAERIVLAARNSEGKPFGTVLRLSAVYGPRLKGNYRRLVRALARRRFIPLGRGDNRRPVIYDKDAARAAVLAAEHPAAIGEIFNVSDRESATVNEIIASICDALERPRPRFNLPIAPIRWAVRLASGTASLLRVKLPIGPATVDRYVEDMVIDTSKIHDRLGFESAYDPQTGWRETIKQLRATGQSP